MQDNDPKHTSATARRFFSEEEINWWKTPPESPDANPIENLWHELKEYIRREIKPSTKVELIAGIEKSWDTVSVEKCNKYINHLRKVLPRIIHLDGAATGYYNKLHWLYNAYVMYIYCNASFYISVQLLFAFSPKGTFILCTSLYSVVYIIIINLWRQC